MTWKEMSDSACPPRAVCGVEEKGEWEMAPFFFFKELKIDLKKQTLR